MPAMLSLPSKTFWRVSVDKDEQYAVLIIGLTDMQTTDIYRIVSTKIPDQNDMQSHLGSGPRAPIDLSKSADEGSKKGGCC